MIFVFPMLTSGDVSGNVIPGICAVLEKFILIYETDAILKSLRKQRIIDVVRIKHRLVAREGYQIEQKGKKKKEEEDLERDQFWSQQAKEARKSTRDVEKEKEKLKKDLEKEKKERKKAEEKLAVSVDFPRSTTLSAEPTYVTITTPEQGKQLLGVKVIAFPVSSDKALFELLTKDRLRGFFSTQLKKLSRGSIRKFYSLCKGLKIPFIASKTLTGDPKIDILWAGTEFGIQNFVLLNFMEFSEEGFFDKPRMLKKLFRLGWSSLIVADDATKRAMFCMKQFKGVCTSIMYSFMFSTLGSEHARVYSDLEEVRRSAGPFFRTKISKRKLFGESLALSKLSEYRDIVGGSS